MGAIMTQITITNADDRALFIHGHIQQADVRTYALEALVDTGAVMLALPEDVVQHLGLRELSRKTFILADGSTLVCPVAGLPVEFKSIAELLDLLGQVLNQLCLDVKHWRIVAVVFLAIDYLEVSHVEYS